MTWYAVYEEASGKLTSTGTRIAEPGETEADAIARLNARGLGVKILAGDPRLTPSTWNSTTLEFDATTPPLPHVEKSEFLALFTEAEREDIFEAARKHTNANVKRRIQAFLDWLKIVEIVELGDAYMITAVNGMESAGLIDAGRADIILAGGV